MQFAKSIIFIVLAFVIQCCNTITPNFVSAPLVERINIDSISISMKALLKKVDDSGRIGDIALNYSDSLSEITTSNKEMELIFKNLWNSKNWNKLANLIALADQHGLDKEWYHYSIFTKVQKIIDSKCLDSQNYISYDSIATYFLFAIDGAAGLIHDLSIGRLNSSQTGIANYLHQSQAAFLWKFLANDNFEKVFIQHTPNFEPYLTLFKEYNRLRQFEKKELNYYSKAISLIVGASPLNADSSALLIMRQIVENRIDLNWVPLLNDRIIEARRQVYDALLVFQKEFHISETGKFDKQTIIEMTLSKSEKLNKLIASMERWRQLGHMFEKDKVVVNIAANELFAIKNDSLKLHFVVCSGKERDVSYYKKLDEYNKVGSKTHKPDNLETPLMKSYVSHFVINPTWSVPHNIATKEMLPDIIQNPGSLAKNHFIVKNKKGEIVNPYAINWRKYSPRNFPFRIEQKFGDFNALGRMVIHFSNPYSIFLHDTPSKYAFSYSNRHVSHGCVRMANPFGMMEFLCTFNKHNNLDLARIQAGLEPLDSTFRVHYQKELLDSVLAVKYTSKPKQYFKVDKKIAIYICYFTAYVHVSNLVHYATDGYKSDIVLINSLKRNYKN